jgi:hypothetical protein
MPNCAVVFLLLSLAGCRYLGNNLFSGLLPDEYAAMEKLQLVYLNNNNFFGQIPSKWAQMESLTGM